LAPSTSSPSGPRQEPLSAAEAAFYRRSMAALEQGGIPFLVGGAYAFAAYTGIVRHTKDFDLFILPRHFDAALAALAGAGYAVERNFPHWLGKAYSDGSFVDLIFGSGNGLTPVDESWFEHARPGEVLGMPVRLCPAEEMIWSKAFIMERERFDGADVAHLLHCCAEQLDWQRLLHRFGDHWRVLLSHLVLFGYIYPADAARLPRAVVQGLIGRLAGEVFATAGAAAPAGETVCRGTVLSRAQYLFDVETRGYLDARLPPSGTLSAEEVERWTAAIDEDARGPGVVLKAGQGGRAPADPPDR
jgi:Nucleotidyl transferase of unknown function (DUF2204)